MPTKTQVETWNAECLEAAASSWAKQSTVLKETYDKAQHDLESVNWSGDASDRARDRLKTDADKVRAAIEQLEHAEEVARRGANSISAAKRLAVAAIHDAEQQFFTVSEDLTVSDPLRQFLTATQRLRREAMLPAYQATIRAHALMLAATDARVAAELKRTAADLENFKLGGGPGTGPGDGDSTREPTITGPAGPLKYEQDQYDLQDGYPDGKGPTFGGDPRSATDDGHKYPPGPRSPESEKANDPNQPGTRPIPTGTALGPNDKRYAFFSYPDVNNIPEGNNPFSTAGKAWDFTDPNHPVMLGPLKDTTGNAIYQASGAYDPKTGRMAIVGNTGPKNSDTRRVLWESDPIKPGDPPGKWLESLHQVGTVQGLPGARENQLVALQGGGFALAGSDNFDPANPTAHPAVSAVTASTPEGLLTARPTVLIPPQNFPGGAPYGPTIIGTHLDPVTHVETVDVRVSTWSLAPRKDAPYNPTTQTTSFGVQH
jgi:hypothetical protein